MDVTITLLPFVLLAIVMVLANLEAHDRVFRLITFAALGALNLLFIMTSLLGLAVQPMLESGMTAEMAAAGLSPALFESLGTFMRFMGLAGVLGFLPFIRPLRTGLSRLVPIDPDSAVHTTALVYSVYAVLLTIGQLPLVADPATLDQLDAAVTPGLLLAQALGMVLLALPGVGAFIRRNGQETLQRFGLAPLTLRHLLVALVSVAGLVAFQLAFGAAWQAIDPDGFALVEGVDNVLFAQLLNPGGALLIGLSAAIGEELIFRGAMQPRFGLLLSALIFTAVHVQYVLSPATLIILGIAIVLGLLRRHTTLTVCILVHFGYNFLTVFLAWMGQG